MSQLVYKEEADQHLVYGEVYAPNRPDADGEFMTVEEIRKAAHEFVRSGKMDQLDLMHNGKAIKGCSIVESFIARKDDPVFLPDSWVVGVKVGDMPLWNQIKKGEINATNVFWR